MIGFRDQTFFIKSVDKATLDYQLAFEKLLGSIFTRFLNVTDDDLDEMIQLTLEEIGSFVQADRAYLFLLSDYKQLMSNTHEWCAEGILPQIEHLQDLSLTEHSWIITELSGSDSLYIPLVEDMPESAQIAQELLAMQGIKSLLLVPLMISHNLAGFLGFDAVTEPRLWSKEDINLLAIIAKILAFAKERKRSHDIDRITRQLLDSIGEGIFIIRHPDTISEINQAFSRITGYHKEDIVGKHHQLLDLVERDWAILGDMHKKLTEQGNWTGIVKGIHKDGHVYPASLSISTHHDTHEHLTRHLVIFQDLTEHQKLIQERNRLQKQTLTAQKLNSLSTMSAGMVHEIAQPLNSIKVLVDGMLYCHQNSYALPETEIFEKLGEVSTEIKRIDEIIQHMRSFARLNQSDELSPCNWNEAVRRALGLLGRQLAAHEIIVSTMLQPNAPQIYANPNRLDEILLNLLVNSMQALDATRQANKEIICRTFHAEDYTTLEIADNASGIDDSIQEMIFEPFFTTKPAGQGMGMGLSIVESIMSLLNGQISVYNNDNGGATFRLELPVKRA